MVRHTENHHERASIPLPFAGGRCSWGGRGPCAGRRTSRSGWCSCSSRPGHRRGARPAAVPPGRGVGPRARADRRGGGGARRARHPAALRRHDRRPDGAQGYVQAQERFYEMDVRRHTTAGRLSELFGPDTLETDEFVRTLGWRRVAEQELPLLEPETRAALEAYAVGVNAYLEDRSLSEIAVEYTVLGLGGLDYRPEPWTAVDSLAWLKAMAWDLKGNIDEEIERALASVGHTPEQVAELFPPYDYAGPRPDRRRRGRRRRRLRAGRRGRAAPATRERPAFTADQRAPAGRAAPHAGAAAVVRRTRRRGGQQQLGRRRRALRRPASRCWPTTRTSASACRGSGCRWGCTARP